MVLKAPRGPEQIGEISRQMVRGELPCDNRSMIVGSFVEDTSCNVVKVETLPQAQFPVSSEESTTEDRLAAYMPGNGRGTCSIYAVGSSIGSVRRDRRT